MKKLKYNPKYPVKHLSIRVPWHDSKWNGTVCKYPSANSACLVLKGCSESRKDKTEDHYAGYELPVLQQNTTYTPPCVAERATFMANFDLTVSKEHPYSKYGGKSSIYSDMGAVDLTYKRKSAAAVPFHWLHSDFVKEKKNRYPDLDYVIGREPYHSDRKKYGFTKTWTQTKANQEALLNCFFEHIETRKSLVIFYAKQVPFVESNERIVVGVGFVDNVIQNDAYPNSNNEFQSMLWEHTIEHSISDSNQDGFLLPYHEALEYQKEHQDFDPSILSVKVPVEYTFQFSYASEHVSDDALLWILNECKSKVEIAKKLKIGNNWLETEIWLQDRIAEIQKLRGDYPGLGTAFRALGIDKGHYLAQSLLNKSKEEGEDVWDILRQEIKNESELINEFISHENKKLLEITETLSTLQLLSRFDLTIEQCRVILDDSQSIYLPFSIEEAKLNPYILYEISINSQDHYPISFHTIDNGLMLNRDKALYPENVKNRFSANSAERIRALFVNELEKGLTEGHTFLIDEHLKYRIQQLSLDPQLVLNRNIRSRIIEISKNDDKIVSVDLENGQLGFQLCRLKNCSDIIRKEIVNRLKGHRHKGYIDWKYSIESYFNKSQQIVKVKGENLAKGLKEKELGLQELYESPLSVLMGSAGTGKTTLLNIFCQNNHIQDSGVIILTPTGKSRVRVEEASQNSNVEVKTIAQFLVKSKRYRAKSLRYQLVGNQDQNSSYKTLIIDESSMLTEEMLAAVFESFSGLDRIILVGDPKQLPPIGGGRPFVDIINFLKRKKRNVPYKISQGYVELTVPFRDIGKAVEFANLFTDEIGNDSPEDIESLKNSDSPDLRFHIWNEDNSFENMLDKVLLKSFNISDSESFNRVNGSTSGGKRFEKSISVKEIEKWQILSPIRGNIYGTTGINRYLHEKYRKDEILKFKESWKSPKPYGTDEIIYGDKVISLTNENKIQAYPAKENNYIANGEIGLVVGYNKDFINIEFSSPNQIGFTYGYKSRGVSEDNSPLELAYALTIHKAQGSQFGRTVLVFPKLCFNLSRELIYTALTRQQNGVDVLVQDGLATLLSNRFKSSSDTYKRLTNLFYQPRVGTRQTNASGINKTSFFDYNLIHCTSDNKMLRSKSELLIYEALKNAGLSVEYEKSLEINGVNYKPDFTIQGKYGGQDIYWEHLGMLSVPEYKKKWERKKSIYKSFGVVEGENLIVSKDDMRGGISMKQIVKLIQHYFDETPEIKETHLTTQPSLINGVKSLIETRFKVLQTQIKDIKENKLKADQVVDQRLLEISQKIDQGLETRDEKKYEKRVKKNIAKYKMLLSESKRYLVESYFIKDMIKKSKRHNSFYDAFILQHIRSIEFDILHRLFIPFIEIMNSTNEDLSSYLANDLVLQKTSKFARIVIKKSKKLTLGEMVFILNLIKKESGKTIQESELLKEFRKHVITLVDPELLTSGFLANLQFTISEYRNGAAHDRSYNKESANEYQKHAEEMIRLYLEAIKS